MKKSLKISGIILLVAAVAAPVLARGPGWGGGPRMMGYDGTGPGYCRQFNPNVSPEQQGALSQLDQQFFNDTAALRNRIWSKRAELEAVVTSENPDVEKAKATQQEISDLRAELAQKRLDHDLQRRKIVPNSTYGRGYGWGGRGPGRQFGMGPGRGYCR